MPDAKTKPSKPKSSWRDVLPIHPAAELFPMMTPDELKTLGEDIRKNRLHERVTLYGNFNAVETWQLLDGRNRLDAMELVGLPVFAANGEIRSELWAFRPDNQIDPYEFVISANIHRHHLTAEQRRDLIEKVLKAQPSKSNRTIAKQTSADHKTVGTVRDKLEARAEIPHVSTVEDSKGRQQPAHHKPPSPPATPPEATTDSDQVHATPELIAAVHDKIIAKCVADVTTHIAKAVEHLDEIGCVRLLEKLQAIINMLVAEANMRVVDSIFGEESPEAAERATEPETKPPSLAEPPPEMVECPKCHGTGNMDDDGIPEFLRRQPS